MRKVSIAVLALAFGVTCATPSSSATATPATTTPAASELARLFGSWTCEGFAAGSSSVETYARHADGSVTLTNRVHTSVGSEGIIVETFVFDPTRGTWTLSAPPNPLFGGLKLSGARWSGDRWVLTGTEVVQNVPRPVRIVYTSLGNGAFRREHQAPSGSAWVNDGEFVCERSGASAAPLAAVPVPLNTPRPAATRAAVSSTTVVRPSLAPPTTPAALSPPLRVAAGRLAPPSAEPLVTAAPHAILPSRAPRAILPSATPLAILPTTAPPGVVSPSVAPSSAGPPSLAPTTLTRSTVAPRNVAPPSPSPSPSPVATRAPAKIAARPPSRTASPRIPAASDRAFALVGPTWSCESVGGEPSKHRYTRSGADGITLHDDVRVAQHTYAIVETYRFDAARRLWTTAVQGGGYTGTASPWLHNKWIFDGIETERGRRSPVRMIYTTLGDQAFRRDFQLAGAGETQTFVSETCTRS